ncbi:hypothetical protein PACTADRAFT_51743 [Pachysolen tannophilus NRRL Y-2460]|uniref:Uncharacterized protein n=1 Tax=Pachysolen tannophilus NRRL Y-2460 TaxID=669874 RepID=A0A1E4TQG2_PACTA|nr:hypothetical protein PACTADRAFT_51743 [Pachysolen tannophilus NRRL Y-2460]
MKNKVKRLKKLWESIGKVAEKSRRRYEDVAEKFIGLLHHSLFSLYIIFPLKPCSC